MLCECRYGARKMATDALLSVPGGLPSDRDEIRSRQIETEKSPQLFRNKNGRGVAECSDFTNPAAA
jgi:hypothetical protein